MRIRLSLFLWVCMVVAGNAQDKPEFGTITVEDFNDQYKPESPASVLFNYGKSTFSTLNDVTIVYTQETRIQIHQQAGADYAEISIPYYQDGYGKTELIEEVEAYSYNINTDDGIIRTDKVQASDIYTEDINERWKVKKFVFPNVREGSIIEYRYVKRTPFLFNPPDWEFQMEIPVKESIYEIQLIPFYEYSYLLQGASRFDGYTSKKSLRSETYAGVTYNFMIHRYTMRNLPAFTDESFITSKKDYITKLDFQLAKIHYPNGTSRDIMTSWPEISNDFLDSDAFGKYLKQSSKSAGDVLEGNPILRQKENQVQNIVRFVRNNYAWDGNVSAYTGIKAREFADASKGNSAEINLFLCALLKEAGYDAHPVLISTRNNGKVHVKYPFSHYFNDVIVAIRLEGGILLADGTEAFLPYNRLPLRCLNEVGLLVEKDGESWVSLESRNQSVDNKYLEMEIVPELQQVKVAAVNRLSEYDAYAARRTVFDMSDKLKESRLSIGLSDIEGVTIENALEPEKNYIVKFAGSRAIDGYDDKLIIQPFNGLIDSESPFKATSRRYPVDMIYPSVKQFTVRIKVPEGYSVVELPKEFNMNDDLFNAAIDIRQDSEYVHVTGNLAFKSAVYQPRDYEKLRSRYSDILNAMNQMIVLSRN